LLVIVADNYYNSRHPLQYI